MDAPEYAAQVEDLEKKLERLRALYEQYFTGIERLEPSMQRKALERKIADLRKNRVHNTALRFRLQALVQRYTTLLTYWIRVCRQIEEGTYKRDLMRAGRLAPPTAAAGALQIDVVVVDPARPGGEPPDGKPQETARVRSLDDLRALLGGPEEAGPPPAEAAPMHAPVSPARPPPEGAPPPPRPAPPVAAAPSQSALAGGRDAADVHDATVARIREGFRNVPAASGRAAAPPSMDAVRAALRKELDRMRAKHPGKEIDFRVEVKDGKPVIKSFVK